MGKATTYIWWPNVYEWTDILIDERKIIEASLLFIGSHVAMRWRDLSHLRWSQLLYGEFDITESKRKAKRKIHLSDEALNMVKILWEHTHTIRGGTRHDLIFTNKEGKVFSNQYANKLLMWIGKKFNADHPISTHSLRKTLSRYIYDLDPTWETIIQIQALLGHKSPFQTITYLGIRDTEIKNLYMKAGRPK